jgi:hypothetical protein
MIDDGYGVGTESAGDEACSFGGTMDLESEWEEDSVPTLTCGLVRRRTRPFNVGYFKVIRQFLLCYLS